MTENPIDKVNADRERFYKQSLELGPSPFLKFALEYATVKDEAIDIGAGAMLDTKQIVDAGFTHVIASDVNPNTEGYLIDELRDHVSLKTEDVNSFDYPADSFDLVYSSKALQYLKAENTDRALENIFRSIRKGGLFVGAIFGLYDDQVDLNKGYFPTFAEIKSKFKDSEWKLIKATKRDSDSPNPHYEKMNLYGIIARKI